MSDAIEIDLCAVRFEAQPVILLRLHGIEVRTFRYSTGIAGLTVTTPVGEVTALPFKGQQVWRAAFNGRPLTMRSMFDEPQPTTDYLATYGAFLIHCGISAMGGPGPEDSHPLHGEMPNARFETARLLAGSDAGGPFLTLSGECTQARAFSHHYRFQSAITLRPTATRLDVAVTVENLRPVPLELMYLAHVNFRPVDDGRLLDTVSDDRAGIALRAGAPAGLQIPETQRRMMANWAADPARHRHLLPGNRIDPEAVLFLECRADAEGWAHGMQLHPDGQADFISYRAAELPVAVRWISRLGDQDALGLILPATAGVDGFTAEKAKGRVVSVPPGGSYACRYRCGALDAAGARSLARHIELTGRATPGS
ncbi:DUF4432 family protein [Dongia sedimenti]|uniref:DUF4432 family protein n=1 Tax=Dongia sedimenti TaxID=3064282 RepID=A0ABU0YT96_9PROT|nr:DUF4432 family protein [Rhodospirillaceae bacterium R-7]